MKKLLLLITLTLLVMKFTTAQNHRPQPSFKDRMIKTSDLIVEGTITSISYFRDTSTTVKFMDMHFNNTAKDALGRWFIKYEITIHKVFKGEKLTKVTVVNASSDFAPEIDSLLVYPTSRNGPLGSPYQGNLRLNTTGVFFITKSYTPALPFDSSFYYANQIMFTVGFYHLIGENRLGIIDKGEYKSFETLLDFYSYLEQQIGKKRIDVTKKEFVLTNTPEKVHKYLKKHFNDSAYSTNLIEKIDMGKINQLNVDSFLVAPTPPLSEKMLGEIERVRDSTNRESRKRYLEMDKRVSERYKIKKQGSLNKSGENHTYTFSNIFYSKTGTAAYLEYDISGNSNISKINQITIYDKIGNVIKVISCEENKVISLIDVSDLKVGLYFIQTKTEDKIYNNRFVKE